MAVSIYSGLMIGAWHEEKRIKKMNMKRDLILFFTICISRMSSARRFSKLIYIKHN